MDLAQLGCPTRLGVAILKQSTSQLGLARRCVLTAFGLLGLRTCVVLFRQNGDVVELIVGADLPERISGCVSNVVCCTAFAAYCMLHGACHTAYVAWCMLHVVCGHAVCIVATLCLFWNSTRPSVQDKIVLNVPDSF